MIFRNHTGRRRYSPSEWSQRDPTSISMSMNLREFSLYDSGLLADVTIQVKDHKIRAHRAILAKTSSWFVHQFANDPTVSVQDRK